MQIVSIDDESHILHLIQAILQEDYGLTLFSNARDALQTFNSGLKADLIICDISMPELDGFAFHEELRQQEHLRAIPFIFLTALSDRQTFRKGMLQGADDYLTKPFTVQELKEAVTARLNRSHTLKDTESQELVITSLGGVGLTWQGQQLHYEAKKVVELLLYLLTQNQAIPLRLVTPDLWYEQVVDNNLHVLINRARKTYAGLVTFPVEGDLLSVKPLSRFYWDAALFEQSALKALKQHDFSQLEHASRLFKGTFLPGFESPWTDQQRSYYESLYLQVLELGLERAPNELAHKSMQLKLNTFLGDSWDDASLRLG